MKDNTDIKKTSNRPADPETQPLPEQQQQLRLQAFSDGYIFKFTPHPTEPGRFVLFDTNKQPVGVIGSAPIADLICQAVKMLFDAVQERAEKPIDVEAVAPAPDNIIPLPGVVTLPPNNIVPLTQPDKS